MTVASSDNPSIEKCQMRRKCQQCGTAFIPRRRDQRYHQPRCRFDSRNKKRAALKGPTPSVGRSCEKPDCKHRSRLGRTYRHVIDGREVILCGLHHAERYRPGASGRVGVLIGRYYHGFLHISIYDVSDQIVGDDGGIAQLIENLSGGGDSSGRLIPHPLEHRLDAGMYTS